MRNFISGIVIGIIGFLAVGDMTSIVNDKYLHGYAALYKLESYYIFPGIGLKDPLTGRCTKEIRQAPGGPKVVMRDYFECNYIQNKISDFLNKA